MSNIIRLRAPQLIRQSAKSIVFMAIVFLISPNLGFPRDRNSTKIALRPHVQANQESMDIKGQHGKSDIVAREWDGSLYAEATLAYFEGDARTVYLFLAIKNQSADVPPPPSQLFIPSTILIVLPNGHSYRPFNQTDVIQAAQAIENRRVANTYSGYNPPPVTSSNTNCSLSGDTASCRTTADQSAQAAYAIGYALGAAITNAFAIQKAKKYIQQVKTDYLVSQQIPLGGTVIGYVEVYIEDIHSGPFTVRVPVGGDKTYDFVFGPEEIPVPAEK